MDICSTLLSISLISWQSHFQNLLKTENLLEIRRAHLTARIPGRDLRIDEDWYVTDLVTTEDCEEAIVHLTRQITHINLRLKGAPPAEPGVQPPQWVAQAESARAVKAAIRGIAQRRQSEILKLARIAANDSDRQQLIDALRVANPRQFDEVLRAHRERARA